jgi:lambda family phage portal protein
VEYQSVIVDEGVSDKRLLVIETEFAKWSQAVKLSAKLRTAVLSKKIDGEIFFWKTTNPRNRHPITLDPKLIEGDQVTTPTSELLIQPNVIDGIKFDEYGNPIEYHILKYHPGAHPINAFFNKMEFDRVPAEHIIHWFREDRPGQRRGMPELASALPLFGMIRRYTLAVLAAAETAADFAAVMYSDSPAVDPDDVEPMDAIELESRAMLTLPRGWKLGQIKAEQPVDTYEMFKKLIIQEIARCISMPFNIATGDSSGYNYSSGKLDHQTYYKSIDIERQHLSLVVLDDLFNAWMDEAFLTSGYMPSIGSIDLGHTWQWDGFEHVDPQKEAAAAISLVDAGLLTRAEYHASRGRDWETEMEQQARELKKKIELGLDESEKDDKDGNKAKADSETE